MVVNYISKGISEKILVESKIPLSKFQIASFNNVKLVTI